MAIAHTHNLNDTPPAARPYGIRASLRARDPFVRLVGAGWEKFHWYATERERDAAFEDMAARHLYSRQGDEPSVRYEKVSPPA
ncbi:MAG TPA: hypothetical protein VFR77_04955 [Steroidobacteraceae bacterium]|nr:hypothetical protein [Steroidobacteraceae bacterium]